MIIFLCIISYLLSTYYLFLCFDSKMESYCIYFEIITLFCMLKSPTIGETLKYYALLYFCTPIPIGLSNVSITVTFAC